MGFGTLMPAGRIPCPAGYGPNWGGEQWFQVGPNPGGSFRRRSVQGKFDDGGDKSLDFPPLPRGVPGSLHAAE